MESIYQREGRIKSCRFGRPAGAGVAYIEWCGGQLHPQMRWAGNGGDCRLAGVGFLTECGVMSRHFDTRNVKQLLRSAKTSSLLAALVSHGLLCLHLPGHHSQAVWCTLFAHRKLTKLQTVWYHGTASPWSNPGSFLLSWINVHVGGGICVRRLLEEVRRLSTG